MYGHRISVALSCLLAVGCSVEDEGSAGDRGKSDDLDADLLDLVGDELDAKRDEASVDVVRYGVIDTRNASGDGIAQRVKLFCTDTGTSDLPLVCYLGVVPIPGERGAFELYRVGRPLTERPAKVAIDIAGTTATVRWQGSTRSDGRNQDVHYTATVKLTAAMWEPTIKVALTCNQPDGTACSSGAQVSDLDGTEELELATPAAVHFLEGAVLDTSTATAAGYHQSIKLWCGVWGGGGEAPVQCYVGVVPLRDRGGAFEVYRVKDSLFEDPKRAKIAITGAKATVSWEGATEETGPDVPLRYQVTLKLSGSTDDPKIITAFGKALL